MSGGITVDGAELATLKTYIDEGNSDTVFLRSYGLDEDDGIVSTSDFNLDGTAYSVTGPVRPYNVVESNSPNDFLSKVSGDDSTGGFLEDKVTAGANITITTSNPGSNEALVIAGVAPVFGSRAEDFLDTSNTNVTGGTNTLLRTYTTQSNPAGRYRIAMNIQVEPNATANNYRFQLRIDGTQIGLEMEEEGKDAGGDQRNKRPLLGYYTHASTGTFDIELWGSVQSGTGVVHGSLAEVWRVS